MKEERTHILYELVLCHAEGANIKKPIEVFRKANAIEIPDNATNGDVIKAMFGEPAKEEKAGVLYKFRYRNGKPYFSTFYDWDWWNAPYKREAE